ncbi:CYTH domain protein [Mariniflexile rhizosphaerae]|uniref:CYTH domain-containing protein n=1 Tax=unclassified Mariniflexile TaxID=2643887 RepID=UPI000CB728AE|nr:CYTH domain-containing protein [Mariniflexile sp. TRM1-10]AXP80763.1 CYTH domain protein [Mariniflexile sp. TRM1-10]PLB19835.1 MAG: CYTH domain protein [Flavobacteriaceae bacterium FS1-H7996/R]
MVEIERKFLVTSNSYKNEAFKSTRIIQGFLNTHKDRTVRIRLKGNTGFITVKGLSTNDGLSRFEWEKGLLKEEAEALLKLCEPGVIDKIRYEVKFGDHIFEVDEFYSENEGLVIAEVELNTENEAFLKPDWLGEEVTGTIKYYNSQLSKRPFKTW